jgi:hypothetical protein
MIENLVESKKKSMCMAAVYREVAVVNPSRPFMVSVQLLAVASELNLHVQEAKSIFQVLRQEGMLSLDKNLHYAYMTPKGMKFLQNLATGSVLF